MFEIEIDGKKILVDPKKTILEIAIENDIKIPYLCYDPDIPPKESCRLCVVDIKGELFPACATYPKEGMVIKTETEEILKVRKTNLKLLFSQHIEKCNTCIWNNKCKMLNYAREWGVAINEWEDRKIGHKEYNFKNTIIYDSSKCINCFNCVDVCEVGFLEIKNKGSFHEIVPSSKKECIYCGQCLVHCPSGAFSSFDSSLKIEEEIQKGKNVVFQVSPFVCLGMGVSNEHLIGAIRKLGVKKVFDLSLGENLFKEREAEELELRIQKKEKLPMLSCFCPAFVQFVKAYRKDLISNLSKVSYPHILLKEVIEEKEKDAVVVSVLPCTAVKYKSNDYILTTHELSRMLKKNKIDFNDVSSFDEILEAQESEKVKTIYGILNAKKALESLDANFLRVEACPKGCAFGGGQLVPTKKRLFGAF
ncbi:MAG: [Fe-Fe] hydrogenase large subunit C-terminal domain-containing protein [Candidatus Paceibacterota bacterium]